jgi:glycerophosphoryl diester phosphodiesterase
VGLRYFEPGLPRVFAHRGLAAATELSEGAPENTMLAFAAALGVGVSYIETDVHGSRDGVSVISHDPDLTRLAGIQSAVNDYTMAELRTIDLGADQGFCSLAEALDAFPETRFNIDIKSEDAVQPTVDAIIAANAVGRVLVTSFSEARRLAAVQQLPGVATSTGASRFARALATGKLGATPLLRSVLRDVDCVQIPMTYGPVRITTPRMIRRLHEAGVEVHVWTINDAPTMHALLDLGVDGLVTDRADIAMQVLEARRT